MQRLFLMLLFTVFPAYAQTSIVFTWGTNPSDGDRWLPCSKSVKKMCRAGYTLTDVTATSAPIVITSSIPKDSYTYSLTPLPSPGLHTYNIVVNAKGAVGKALYSDPSTVTVDVPYMFSNPPSGFRAIATARNIVFMWAGSQNINPPVCSKKIKTACLIAYTLRDVTRPTEPVTISSSIGSVFSFTLDQLPESGTHTYSLVANGIDQNGTPRSSPPAIATVRVSGS